MTVQEVVRQIVKETGIVVSGACIRKYDRILDITDTRPRDYSDNEYMRLKQAVILADLGMSPFKENTWPDIKARIDVVERSVKYLKSIGRDI